MPAPATSSCESVSWGSQLPACLLPLVPLQLVRKIILCLPGMGKMAVDQVRLQKKKINQEILSNKNQRKGCGTELSLSVPQTATTVFSQPTARLEKIRSRFKAELKPAENKAPH